jgi:VWFA-related protein
MIRVSRIAAGFRRAGIPRRIWPWGAGAAILSGALLFAPPATARPATAQSQAGPIAPKPGQPNQQAPATPPSQVKVNLVSAPAVIHNAGGELVLDLQEKDFHVFDNGVPQKLEGFEMGGAPLSVVIVAETSSRIEALLPAVRRTGIVFTQTVLGPNGDAAIISYDDEVNPLSGFTSDRDAIERTMANLREGTSGARLYDALSQAVNLLRDRPAARRRVILTVAEAVDTASEEKLGEVLREAQLANITIYSVGLSSTAAELRGPQQRSAPLSATPPGTFGLPPMPGTPQTPSTEEGRAGNVDLMALAKWIVLHVNESAGAHPLELATAATGGAYESTLRDKSIEPAIDRIGGELNAQYTLSYRPAGADPTGYHEIMVTVDRRGLKVRSRPGYYLEAPAK